MLLKLFVINRIINCIIKLEYVNLNPLKAFWNGLCTSTNHYKCFRGLNENEKLLKVFEYLRNTEIIYYLLDYLQFFIILLYANWKVCKWGPMMLLWNLCPLTNTFLKNVWKISKIVNTIYCKCCSIIRGLLNCMRKMAVLYAWNHEKNVTSSLLPYWF